MPTGTVLKEMTAEQVLSVRGAPIRRERIPPDAELWHYAEGEVAFSQGKVSYVDLEAPAVSVTALRASPPDRGQTVAEKRQAPNNARVHAPGDGFLALRSEPTTRAG